jgi:hypothetical protein
MSIMQLQNQIKEGKDKLAHIQQSKTGFDQQLSTLRAEEQSLIVSARTGDKAAKDRLSEVRKVIYTAQKETQDDAAAISTVASQVETLRMSLASEQRDAERTKILIKVAQFAERAQVNSDRISAAASELREIGDICMAEAQQVRGLLIELSYNGNKGSDRDHRHRESSLERVNLSSMCVMQALSQAADTLEKSTGNHSRLDCMDQMQRFITALGAVTLALDRESEQVSA